MNLITLVIRLTKMELPHCLSNDASRKKRPYPTEVFSNKLSVSHRVAPDDLFKIFSSYLIAFFSALPRALALLLLVSCCGVLFCQAQKTKPQFKVIAFYTGKRDTAHISFVHEANRWFPKIAARYNFIYDSTNDWSHLNAKFLSHYQVVIFLDTRPEQPAQREAFKKYMDHGGAWMGFHFAGFALTPSDYPQNWDWYHNVFIGAGQYKGNTWRPTSAILRVEDSTHPVTRHLPQTFRSSPNEWYSWEKDIRTNPDIKILLSIDSTSFPLGTGPKSYEIWHSGYYPVVWTNKKYKMLYLNMGHNDIDYEHKTNKELSFQFDNAIQNELVTNGILWLGRATAHNRKLESY